MIVTTEVYTWTASGMKSSTETHDGFIPVFEVERLLEEAYRRGWEAGLNRGEEIALKVIRKQG